MNRNQARPRRPDDDAAALEQGPSAAVADRPRWYPLPLPAPVYDPAWLTLAELVGMVAAGRDNS